MDSINLTGVQRGNNLLSFPFVKSDGTTYHTSEIAEVFANANLQIGGFIGFGVACKLVNNDWVGSGCDIDPTMGYWVDILDDFPGNINVTLNFPSGNIGVYDAGYDYNLDAGSSGNQANLVSYPFESSINIQDLSQGLEAAGITEIIGEGVASTMIAPGTWVGSLDTFEPGRGYWVRVSMDYVGPLWGGGGGTIDPDPGYDFPSDPLTLASFCDGTTNLTPFDGALPTINQNFVSLYHGQIPGTNVNVPFLLNASGQPLSVGSYIYSMCPSCEDFSAGSVYISTPGAADIDPHFGVANTFLTSFINDGNDIIDPSCLYNANDPLKFIAYDASNQTYYDVEIFDQNGNVLQLNAQVNFIHGMLGLDFNYTNLLSARLVGSYQQTMGMSTPPVNIGLRGTSTNMNSNRVFATMFADGYAGDCYEYSSCNNQGKYIGNISGRLPEACCYQAFGFDKSVDYEAIRVQECDATGLVQAFECVAQ